MATIDTTLVNKKNGGVYISWRSVHVMSPRWLFCIYSLHDLFMICVLQGEEIMLYVEYRLCLFVI